MIISSVLIISKRDNISTVFTKRLPRLIVPLLFWSLVYIIIDALYWNSNKNILNQIICLPFQQAAGHLWYLYFMIKLSLFGLLLVPLYYNSTFRSKAIVVGIFFVGKSLLDTIMQMSPLSLSLFDEGWIHFGIMEFLYAVFAMMLFDWFKNRMISKVAVSIGLYLGYALIVVLSWALEDSTGMPPQYFLGHLRFPDILFGSCVFLLFYSLKNQFASLGQKGRKILSTLSGISLGIYLVHPLMGWMIRDFSFLKNNGISEFLLQTPQGNIIYILTTFLASISLCFIMSQIPSVKKLVQ
jgi:hypothetical protein